MRKIITVLLILAMILPAAACADTLHDVQQYIYTHIPASSAGSYMLTGQIMDIYNVETNHWEMKIAVNEEDAMIPFGSEYPYFIAHFRLHVAEVPFHIGETVEVYGSLNAIHSSPAVPCLLVSVINGSSDF